MQYPKFLPRLLLALLAGVMVLLGGCSLSPEEADRKATWVEYRNTEEGLAFWHPDTWQVEMVQRQRSSGARMQVITVQRKATLGGQSIMALSSLSRSSNQDGVEQIFMQTYRCAFTPEQGMRKVVTKTGRTALIWNKDGSSKSDHAVVDCGDKFVVVNSPDALAREHFDRWLDSLRIL